MSLVTQRDHLYHLPFALIHFDTCQTVERIRTLGRWAKSKNTTTTLREHLHLKGKDRAIYNPAAIVQINVVTHECIKKDEFIKKSNFINIKREFKGSQQKNISAS